jgi:hypothetical protein
MPMMGKPRAGRVVPATGLIGNIGKQVRKDAPPDAGDEGRARDTWALGLPPRQDPKSLRSGD